MYRCKNITTAFVLLLILAIPIFFSVLVLLKQQMAQSHRNEKFSKEIIQTITVAAASIYWVKPEKEILVDGKLFDVKSYVKKGASILLTGFFDHKEDKLVQQIVKLALQENQSGSPFSQPAIKFLFFPAYTNQQEIACEASCWKFISQQYYSFTEKLPADPFLAFIQPPEL
jgi:hypothetical protein